MTSFDDFRLDPKLADAVRALGYVSPTPIQSEAIPPVMAGRDVMGLAQTGTGKTAAFALPILQRLLSGPRGRVRALIVAPTRELAEQIHEAFGGFSRGTNLRSVTLYGGVGIHPQIEKLRQGVEIAVACPGRLLDHLSQGTLALSALEVLVLDEADQMLDMGFLPSIRQLIAHLPKQRQNLMFSATMPPDIRRLAGEILHNPVMVQIGHSLPATTVSHALFPVEPHLKTPLLMEMLRRTDTESVLVFAREKFRAKRVAQQLIEAGFRAAELQGNLSQARRQAALDGFRDGTIQVLVATDIAARGIDVSSISHVVNYDVPGTADAYTHRIGRTGRAAKTGDAFTLVTRADAEMIRTIERTMGVTLERRALPGFNYSVPRPTRDVEFARPPMPPRRAPKPPSDPGPKSTRRR